MKARVPLTAGLAALLGAASILCLPPASARAEFSAEVLDHSENLMTALGSTEILDLRAVYVGEQGRLSRVHTACDLPYCLGLFLDEELRALIQTPPDQLVAGTTVRRGDFYEVETSVDLKYAVSLGTKRVDSALIGMTKRYDDKLRVSVSSTVIQYAYDAVGRLVRIQPSTGKTEDFTGQFSAFRTEGSIRYEMASLRGRAPVPFIQKAQFSVTRGQVGHAGDVVVDLQAGGWVKYATHGYSAGETAFRETNTPTEGLREKGTIRDYYRLTAAGIQPVRSVESREDARHVGGLVIRTNGAVIYTPQPGRGISAHGRFTDDAADPYGFRQTQIREDLYGTQILGRAFLRERKVTGRGLTAWNPALPHVEFRFGGPAFRGQPVTESYTYDAGGRLTGIWSTPIRIESSKRLGRQGSFTSVTTVEKDYQIMLGRLVPNRVKIRQETAGSGFPNSVSRMNLVKNETVTYLYDAVGRLNGATNSYGEFSGEIWERVGDKGPEVKKGIKGNLGREYGIIRGKMELVSVLRRQEETFPAIVYGYSGTERKQYESRTRLVLGGTHPDWDGPNTRPNLLLGETTETVDITTDSTGTAEHFVIYSLYGIPPGQPKVWGVVKSERL